MKTNLVSAAAITAALFLAGCASTPKSTDAELNARIAYLEGRLDEREAQAASAAHQQSNIEDQVSRIAEFLDSESAAAAVADEAIQETSAPVDTAETAAPAAAAAEVTPEGSLIKRSDQFEFQKATAGWRKFVAGLEKRYETSTKLNAKHNRSELIGQPLPQSRFLGPDGSIVDLNDYRGKKNVVLVVLRGFPGFVCPACSAQTVALMRNEEKFVERDAQVVLVYPGAAESIPAFVDSIKEYESETPLHFPVLLDVNLGAVEKFDIKGALAKPTSLIVDKEGLVRFAYVGESYDDRPSAKLLLEALDETSK
jgi:peroxiredoxin/outer membrane murein-binding lipoprotein Lpp